MPFATNHLLDASLKKAKWKDEGPDLWHQARTKSSDLLPKDQHTICEHHLATSMTIPTMGRCETLPEKTHKEKQWEENIFFKLCQQTEKRNWFLLCQKNKHHLCHLYYDVIVVKLTHRKFTKNQSHRLIEGVWVSVSDMEQLAFALDTLSHSSFCCSS